MSAPSAPSMVRGGPLPQLVRRPTWDAELARYLEEWRGRPFVWGESDCGQFIAGALAAVAGVPRARILGDVSEYHDRDGAIRAARALVSGPMEWMLCRVGAGPLEARLRALGLIGVDAGLAYAQRGDIVVVRATRFDALGLVWAGAVWTTHPSHACGPHPLADALDGCILLRVPHA